MTEPKPEFKVIVEDHYLAVWRYLHLLGCSPNTADDLTQETFLVLIKKPFTYLSAAQTRSYLRNIARRLFLDSVKRREHRFAPEVLAEVEDLWSETMDTDAGDQRMAALKDCLKTLDQRERQALDMRYSEKQKRKDIGAKLDLSEGGVKKLLSRAKSALEVCINRKLKA